MTSLASPQLDSKNIHSPSGKKEPTFTFWSADFHIAPIADVKDLFADFNVTAIYTIIDESLSGHCHLKGTCFQDLKVLNRSNGIHLNPCPNKLKREFWRAYKDDERMATVDAFFCHHATGLCEIYMAFGRPMIIVASTRYEIGRRSRKAWMRLNENLKAVASNPRNTIAANNRYDAEYVKHFTGLKDVRVLPNYCGYTNAIYNPTRPQVLIGPGRLSFGAQSLISGPNGIVQAAEGNLHLFGTPYKEFVSIRQLYSHFEYDDLAAHPAIVLIPYQVSVMSIFEYYRMGIPLFAPSPDLMTKWQQKYKVMSEITWNCVYGRCQDKSQIPGHPKSPHGDKDPNDLNNFRYWIQFADFYQWPHIVLFDDWEDLFEKLAGADLNDIHNKMMEYNVHQKQVLQRDWLDILDKAFHGVQPRSALDNPNTGPKAQTWEDAVLEHYPNVTKAQLEAKC